MDKVVDGVYVSVEYTGTLGSGEEFDSSRDREPLEVCMGAGQMIKGFEDQLMGMALNETKKFTLSPEDAYGHRNEAMMHEVSRSQIPADMELTLGMMIGLVTPEGHHVPARVVDMDDEKVTMDLNHPLAGETLTFDIKVVGISSTPTQECGSCDGGCDCSGDCH